MAIDRAIAISAIVVSMATPAAATTFGIVTTDSGGALRVFLPSGAPTRFGISVQYPLSGNRTKCCLHFGGDQFESLPPDPKAIDVSTGEPMQQVKVHDSTASFDSRPFVGIAATLPAPGLRQTRSTAVRTAGGDRAHSCFSVEGFHVKGYRAGRQVSDIYLGLDYAIDRPTCGGTAKLKTSTEN